MTSLAGFARRASESFAHTEVEGGTDTTVGWTFPLVGENAPGRLFAGQRLPGSRRSPQVGTAVPPRVVLSIDDFPGSWIGGTVPVGQIVLVGAGNPKLSGFEIRDSATGGHPQAALDLSPAPGLPWSGSASGQRKPIKIRPGDPMRFPRRATLSISPHDIALRCGPRRKAWTSRRPGGPTRQRGLETLAPTRLERLRFLTSMRQPSDPIPSVSSVRRTPRSRSLSGGKLSRSTRLVAVSDLPAGTTLRNSSAK